MKKRIISAVMALGMIISTMPAALATSTYPSGVTGWQKDERDASRPGDFYVTSDEAYSGTQSMFIDGRASGSNNDLTRVYIPLNTKGGHKISMKVKQQTYGWSSSARVSELSNPDPTSTAFYDGTMWTRTTLENGWVQYDMDYWNEENNNAFIIYVAEGGQYYIDDIKVTLNGSVLIQDDFESSVEINDNNNWTFTKTPTVVYDEEHDNYYWKFSGGDGTYMLWNVPMSGGNNSFRIKVSAKVSGTNGFVTFGPTNEDRYKLFKDGSTSQTNSAVTVTDDTAKGDGWYIYEQTYTNRWFDGIGYNLGLREGWGSEVCIDDIEIWQAAGDNATLKFMVKEDCTPSTHREEPNEITSLSTNGVSTGVMLSWHNPKRDDITGFAIYDGANAVNVSETLKTTNGTLNQAFVTLDDSDVHTFKVVMTAGGEEYTTTIQGMKGTFALDSTGNINSDFFVTRDNTKNGYSLEGGYTEAYRGESDAPLPYGSVSVDTLNKYSGNSSLRINMNRNTHWNSQFKIYIPTTGLYNGKKYKVSYMVKYDHKKSSGDMGGVYTSDTWSTTSAPNMNSATAAYNSADGTYSTGWRKVEIEHTMTADGGIALIFTDGAQNIWVDDIKIVEIDANGNEVGGNIVRNPGFEYKLNNVKVNGNTVTWSVPEGAGFEKVKFYSKVGDTTTEIGSVDASAGTYEVPESEALNETVIVKATRGTYETEIKTFTRTKDCSVKIGGYYMGEDVLNSTEVGDVKADVTIANNKDGLTFKVFTALYEGNKMVNVTETTINPAKGATSTETATIPATKATQTVKTFVFNGSTLAPLTTAATLSPASN